MFDKRWRVYHEKLREQFTTKIIEVQTVKSETVINWQGFDSLDISKAKRLALARHIVKLHNENLNRQANMRRL